MNPDPDADVTFQFNQIQLSPEKSPEVDDSEDADVSFGFNQANDGSKLVELTPENDDVDHEDDDVTFNISQVETDSKSQQFTPENSPENDDVDHDGKNGSVSQQLTPENDDVEKSPENEDSQQFTPEELPEKDDVDNGDNDVTFGSSQVHINNNKEMKPEDADVDDEGDDVDSDDDDVTFGFSQEDADVEGEEFTFMCLNSDNTVTELTEKTVFPLFDQSLLCNNNINYEDGKRINVPVDNVFIESPRDSRADTSSSSSSTLTALTDSTEMNIKSNSTGFSKLWRFRDNNNINRSNSDGRDAFVFLNNEGGNGKGKEGGFLNNAKTEGKGKGKGKGKEKEVVVVKKKVKKANVASAHEVYMKKAKGGEEEFKRKSYLPYRPGLMGFFTNVNGGLSKNVHPF